MELPGRITGVTLVPTATGELTVAWDAPANAETADLLDYPVYLKREAGDWSAAEGRVFTPTGEPGERLSVAYSGLEPGVEYRAGVYARNVVALGAFGNSKPVPAPERTPATLSSMSLTGTSELHFAPHQAGYLVQVDPGVTQTTVRHETAEAGATSEVMVVRTDGTLEADTEDADPNTAGHQARLSSNGDTAVLVRVTSADGVRQEMFGAILDQSANAPVSSKDDTGLRARTHASTLKRPPAGTYSLTLSYGDQSFAISSSSRRYTATVPHDVGQVTVTATVPYGSSGLIPLGDADYRLPGLQVNLQASHPGGRPVQTAFVVLITQPQPLYTWCKLVYFTVTRPSAHGNRRHAEVPGAYRRGTVPVLPVRLPGLHRLGQPRHRHRDHRGSSQPARRDRRLRPGGRRRHCQRLPARPHHWRQPGHHHGNGAGREHHPELYGDHQPGRSTLR